jgi:hypothetical protein
LRVVSRSGPADSFDYPLGQISELKTIKAIPAAAPQYQQVVWFEVPKSPTQYLAQCRRLAHSGASHVRLVVRGWNFEPPIHRRTPNRFIGVGLIPLIEEDC